MAISHAAVPLVGRETELSELTAAYDDAVSGSGRVVMLVGEPGIGKTRLAEELAASAAGKARVLWGRSPEQQSAPPGGTKRSLHQELKWRFADISEGSAIFLSSRWPYLSTQIATRSDLGQPAMRRGSSDLQWRR